ncbi:arsenite efflux MFS transporter ArsK [Mesorhizobium sp. CGMCC 1.15528]|uniref:Arsenite efflux MFS transporter ArsK n=1 Tax=Mesorhizobium zhangyense TaxID=1776730 RepID=A0A7C9V9Q4_9HYPH|nr:arsenite efflux MFS transporter ArsK [Mesorhizobium zhangyense]NGN39691.1 arsenite efflux MFS transporter ArsK [Mesorhizobium zhangyense]
MASAVSVEHRRSAIIWGLGLTQIIGYGTLYYSFSILAPEMARDFDWSQEWVFGVFSASLLVGGLASPFIGRWMDRYGAGQMMALGSIGAALALLLCAFAPERLTFIAGMVAIEMASTFVLYNAAFALLVQITPQTAQRSITHLTLIAGFASTLFWPITSRLHEHLTWREIYLVFAGVNLFVCFPIHWWLALTMKAIKVREASARTSAVTAVVGSISTENRSRAFLLMAVGFALQGFVLSALLIHMVPLLTAVGMGASAVLVGTVFGPSQVFSRFINMLFGKALSPLVLAVVAAAFLVVGLCVLLTTAPWISGGIAFAILFGLGSGLMSIVQGSLPLHLFGSDGYGAMLGRISAVRLIASALAPFLFSFLMAHIGTWSALSVAIVVGIAAAIAFVSIGWGRQTPALAQET